MRVARDLGGRLRARLRRRRSGSGGWLAFLGAFWPFLLGAAALSGGLAAIVLGYLGVAGTVHVGLQLPYLVSGGLLGLALVVAGSALIVAHAVGRQGRILRRLLEEVRTSGLPAAAGTDRRPSGNGMVVAVKGGRSFHRSGCLLVEGKPVRRMRVTTASGRGLAPCRVCDPAPPPGP